MNNSFSLIEEKNGWLCSLAPAKVNLFLHLTGRRDNGYHELESVFAFTKYGDKIKVRPSNEISLGVEGEFAASLSGEDIRENLVFRAAKALQKNEGRSLGAEIILEKNLPVAAGIGGGSSDAAATLRALVELWSVDITYDELQKLALGLGADVPACLNPQVSFVSGIGENIRPIALSHNFGCVLVNNGQEISTPQVFNVFKECNMPFTAPSDDELISLDVEYLAKCKNDLYGAAIKLAPELADLLKILEAQEGVLLARMSGSGATCFALTNKLDEAQNIANYLKEHYPNWWVVASEFIV